MRQANLSQNTWLALAVIAAMAFIVVAVVLNDQATTAFTTINVPSGDDPEANVLDTLNIEAGSNMTIEGGANDTITFTSAATGSSALDLDNDDSLESQALSEIATQNDANSIATESAADKLLLDMGQNWPTADAADALSANGANCAAGNYPRGVDETGAVEDCSPDVDTGPDPDCSGSTTYQDGEGNCDTLYVEKYGAFVQEGTLATTGAGAEVINVRLYNNSGSAMTVQDVHCAVDTAPTGGDLIVDVNENGNTIFSTQANRPQITDGTNEDTSGTPDDTSWADGNFMQIDIDQVGSSTAGADLTCAIRVRTPIFDSD